MKILEQIYEEQFLGFSYGFRPGRRQHDALDALTVGLKSKKVNWALDQWSVWWRKQNSRGDMIIVRYADDVIVGFQHREDAQRFRKELEGRDEERLRL